MKAIKEFQGVPNGEIYPVTYAPGDEVPPELHATARYFGGEASTAGPADLTIPEIKAKLDELKIEHKSGMSKAELLALLPKD
ncbi:hypothetical protein [Acidovorax sp. NCPPB 3576]|uniref:hypothetical protein n=1 Tax=Acidovorax sp. NCPPB 3576 TaxID=2940488 RepID=UPI00234BD07C|nr:hypothetical protein [Acidovorax sp. NCPPB 3576]WCM88841.1 hypothetical protein M5C98_01955 [Acidovorax sp. NCPPB 3576]